MLSPNSVLITGANRGCGLEFCKQFLALTNPPKHVFAGCRNPDAAQELHTLAKANPALHIIQLDVTDESSIARSREAVEAALGGGECGLNLLINNAALNSTTSLADTTKDEMMRCFETNAVGPLLVVQAYLPLLKQAAGSQAEAPLSCSKAAIINISTGVASITENSSGGMYPYRPSKAGLNMITSNLSLDLKADGILCSAIHPGWVKTAMGGPNALISAEESVRGIMKIMASLHGDEGTGKFYHGVRGNIILW